MKVVIDSNVLLVSIPKKSKYRPILDAFLSKQFLLVISNDILSEYREIIAQKTNEFISANIVEMILSATNVEKQDIFFYWQLIDSDKDDNKFVDCSIAGNVDFLVTNDRHFDVLKNLDFPMIKVLNIDEFLKKLANQ